MDALTNPTLQQVPQAYSAFRTLPMRKPVCKPVVLNPAAYHVLILNNFLCAENTDPNDANIDAVFTRQDHGSPFIDSEVAWLHQAWCLSMTHIDGLKLNLLVTKTSSGMCCPTFDSLVSNCQGVPFWIFP